MAIDNWVGLGSVAGGTPGCEVPGSGLADDACDSGKANSRTG
jgi:hypothetical protein